MATASRTDRSVVLDAALALARMQISAQVADDASLDGRSTGLVGLNGALLAGDLAAKDLLGPLWWTPLLVLGVSTILVLLTVFGVERNGLDLGVSAACFYEDQGMEAAVAARELLLAELHRALRFNVARLRRKRARLGLALLALLVGLAVSGALIAFG